eukprot:5873815-Pleurochrysis_carterae.AAC.5
MRRVEEGLEHLVNAVRSAHGLCCPVRGPRLHAELMMKRYGRLRGWRWFDSQRSAALVLRTQRCFGKHTSPPAWTESLAFPIASRGCAPCASMYAPRFSSPKMLLQT